jgi:hypothetical protein
MPNDASLPIGSASTRECTSKVSRLSSRRIGYVSRCVLISVGIIFLSIGHLPETKGFTFSDPRTFSLLPPSTSPSLQRRTRVSRVLDAQKLDTDKEADEATPDQVWDMSTASGSFGNMLLQMQKKEEALIAANETITTLEEQAVDLTPPTSTSSKRTRARTGKDDGDGDGKTKKGMLVDDDDDEPPPVLDLDDKTKQSQLASIRWESIKELDDAVTIMTGPRESFRDNVQEVPLPPLYREVLRERGDAVRSSS